MFLKSCKSNITYEVSNLIYENEITGIVCGLSKTPDKQTVLLKVLNYGRLENKDFAKEIYAVSKEEAKTLKLVSECSNKVPKIYEKWDDKKKGQYVIVMDRIPGTSLRVWMDKHKKKKLEARDITARKYIIIQLCEIMRDINRKYDVIVHRDLKPENIFIEFDKKNKKWEVYIIDFGCANLNHIRNVGTTNYQAPEQLGMKNTSVSISSKTDIFAIGQIFYELLLGAPPKIGNEYQYKARETEWIQTPELDEYLQNIKHIGDIEKIIKRMTSFNPETRPSYNDIIRNLKNIRVG